jgi:hypothetical protein
MAINNANVVVKDSAVVVWAPEVSFLRGPSKTLRLATGARHNFFLFAQNPLKNLTQ